MDISTLVTSAFTSSAEQYPELNRTWIKISFHVGGRLPQSLLSAVIQRDGSIDLVLRCMEDEHARRMAGSQSQGDANMFAFHYQKILSDYWIGSMYETFRLLRQRKLADASPAFSEILVDLELIRMPEA
jgi:hypothetical protein